MAVAGIFDEMRARRREGLDRLAFDGEGKRIDMALLARRGGRTELARTCRGRPRARDIGHEEARARQRGMGQREAGIGLDGAREMRRIAMRGRQHAVAPGDIGVARGRGRSADRQPVSVGEHDVGFPWLHRGAPVICLRRQFCQMQEVSCPVI